MKEKTYSVEGLPEWEHEANILIVVYYILFMIRSYDVEFRVLEDLLKLQHTSLIFWIFIAFTSMWRFNCLPHRDAAICLCLFSGLHSFEIWKIHLLFKCML